MRLRLLVLVLLTFGCSASAHGGADAGPPCPATAPADGDACAASGMRCVYERCATTGVSTATCVAGDGGAGRWSVAVVSCGDCNGRTCSAGTVCIERQSGAQITDCGTSACGGGPATCECLCGAGIDCQLPAYSGSGPLVVCLVGCGASICP